MEVRQIIEVLECHKPPDALCGLFYAMAHVCQDWIDTFGTKNVPHHNITPLIRVHRLG